MFKTRNPHRMPAELAAAVAVYLGGATVIAVYLGETSIY